MELSEFFPVYPLGKEKILELVKTIPTQNPQLIPIINEAIIDYLSVAGNQPEIIWDALDALNVPLNMMLETLKALLVHSELSDIVRDGILLKLSDEKVIISDNLKILDDHVNLYNNLSIETVVKALDKAVLFIDDYYKTQIQSAIPQYRYQSMVDDLKSARIILSTL